MTTVDCAIVTEEGRSFARPKHVVPDGLPPPTFAVRFAVVSPKGEVEARLVAVDSQTGEVGTRTLAHFHTRYFGWVTRCQAELCGTGQLFPPPSRTGGKRFAVPKGEVNRRFGRETRELLSDEGNAGDLDEPAEAPDAVRSAPVAGAAVDYDSGSA